MKLLCHKSNKNKQTKQDKCPNFFNLSLRSWEEEQEASSFSFQGLFLTAFKLRALEFMWSKLSRQMYEALIVINAAALYASVLTNLHPKAQLCMLPFYATSFPNAPGKQKGEKQF